MAEITDNTDKERPTEETTKGYFIGKTRRKIIQIAPYTQNAYSIIALCDDGTLWKYAIGKSWEQIENVPQPEKKKEE